MVNPGPMIEGQTKNISSHMTIFNHSERFILAIVYGHWLLVLGVQGTFD